ncbi:MAG: IPExxxVDY family protein [Bacteroidales bacterium]|nr:IPExxxVDY family protein [Bacteroidales bacterium]
MKKTVLKEKRLNQHDKVLVYAISSSETDLRICMKLNQWLGINLALDTDLELVVKGNTLSFRKYYFEFEEEIEKYLFLVNKNQGQYLFPELKQIDYLLLIHTETHSRSIVDKLNELKKEREFTVLYKVEPASLKSFSRIVI